MSEESSGECIDREAQLSAVGQLIRVEHRKIHIGLRVQRLWHKARGLGQTWSPALFWAVGLCFFGRLEYEPSRYRFEDPSATALLHLQLLEVTASIPYMPN